MELVGLRKPVIIPAFRIPVSKKRRIHPIQPPTNNFRLNRYRKCPKTAIIDVFWRDRLFRYRGIFDSESWIGTRTQTEWNLFGCSIRMFLFVHVPKILVNSYITNNMSHIITYTDCLLINLSNVPSDKIYLWRWSSIFIATGSFSFKTWELIHGYTWVPCDAFPFPDMF